VSLDRQPQLPTVSVETLLKSRSQDGRATRDPERFSGLHYRCATVTLLMCLIEAHSPQV
jgi:hypothetical protein